MQRYPNRKNNSLISWYNGTTINNNTLSALVERLAKKGGKVDKFYLQDWNRNKPALVYLKGWFGGKNIREAIVKALSK